jgi:hypothetical protein
MDAVFANPPETSIRLRMFGSNLLDDPDPNWCRCNVQQRQE